MQRSMAQMSIDVLNWYMKKKKSKQQGVDLNPTI